MDWDWLVSRFDDIATFNKSFTRLELAILASSLNYLEDSTDWTTGDWDTIQAKIADIMNKLDDS